MAVALFYPLDLTVPRFSNQPDCEEGASPLISRAAQSVHNG
jgi:hypothetical protein